MIKVDEQPSNRICQGDIYRDIEHIEHADEIQGIVDVSKIVFPLIIVLSQDCDLSEDDIFRYNEPKPQTQDKYLLSVLVAPLYNVEHFYMGEHLSELGLVMQPFEKRPDKNDNKHLRQNKNPRYHYLEFSDGIPIVPSVIDFKHYFSVDVLYLKGLNPGNLVCKVSALYREDISQRFSSFLSRIGLP